MLMLLLLGSCKKESDNNKEALPEVILEKSSYFSYEMAGMIIRNLGENPGSAQLLLDQSILIEFFHSDSSLVFVMPDLQPGNHSLELKVGESSYSADFTIIELSIEENPDQYISGVIQSYQETISYLETNKSGLKPERKLLLEKDIETIGGWMTQLTLKYETLTDEEKKEALMIMKANEDWINELHESIRVLSQGDLSGTRGWVEDWDKEVEAKMGEFVNAKIAVIKHIPKIVAWIALGALTGSIIPGFGTGVGAAIGAGIALGNLISDLIELNLSIDNLLNLSFLPFEQMVAALNRNALEFTSGQYGDLNITIKYRSPYQEDIGSSVPIASIFITGVIAVREQWAKLVDMLPELLEYEPADINGVTTYKTQTIRIHSDYLSIENVSNSKVSFTTDGTNGEYKVKFTTTDTTDQAVEFDVRYNNPDFGELTTHVQAQVRVVEAFILMGTWKAISLVNGNLDFYYHYYDEYCTNLKVWSWAIDDDFLIITENTFTEQIKYKQINYTYTNLDSNCNYTSFSEVESAYIDEVMPYTYTRNGNSLTLSDEDVDDIEIFISFQGPDTLEIAEGGTYLRQ
jgi:hypothetical protein